MATSLSETKPQKQSIKIERHFTKAGQNPFDTVEWSRRNVSAGDFSQDNVEAPTFWADSSVAIVAKIYFATVDGKRESSIKTLIERVVRKIAVEGAEFGYFGPTHPHRDGSGEQVFNSGSQIQLQETFEDELVYILLHQIAAFNTPVWLNLGVPGRKQVCSACYLLNVEDTILGPDSITEWWANEALIFKGGGGSGANLSKIRGSMEKLSTGGIASGPVAYMRPADAGAGTMKSGGASRRAAKLVQLDIDHPDIIDFIDSKVREDKRMRILSEAGINLDPSTKEGEKNIAECTSFQNANISVRIPNWFMESVENNHDFSLIERTTEDFVGPRLNAVEILKLIAESTWKCADPGIIFDDTVNIWHTTPAQGRINTSNPCCEVHQNDNTSCNLASMNLVKFLDGDNSFKFKDLYQTVDIMITAMDITCSFSDLPTKKIEENTRNFRQLGLGYANLGAALMIQGMPYDSDEGRDWAASVTSLMTARAYKRSGELADSLEPFLHFEENSEAMSDVIQHHINVAFPEYPLDFEDNIWCQVRDQWDSIVSWDSFRNSQVTVLAPTGTISFMMGCDTTGVEPAYSLVSYKSLAGGGSMTLVNGSVRKSLENFGWEEKGIHHALEDLASGRNPFTDNFEHSKVFQTAAGDNPISPDGHLKMVAAIQPHISGAISKTINIPESSTVDDIYNLYIDAWKSGVKCVAVYRDGSKATQVLSTKKADEFDPDKHDLIVADLVPGESLTPREWVDKKESENSTNGHVQIVPQTKPYRKRMPVDRSSITHKFVIGQYEGYITAGLYEDGTPGEIFLNGIGKEGSTLKGMMEAWAVSVSLGLQYGVPLEVYTEKFSHMRFEPEGITNNKEIKFAKSMVDYIMRWMVSKFGSQELKSNLGINYKPVSGPDVPSEKIHSYSDFGPTCSCGTIMLRTGSCYSCPNCGASGGCG